MRKGVTGFPSLIYILIIFLIVAAVIFLLYFALDDRTGGIFNTANKILKGYPAELG